MSLCVMLPKISGNLKSFDETNDMSLFKMNSCWQHTTKYGIRLAT